MGPIACGDGRCVTCRSWTRCSCCSRSPSSGSLGRAAQRARDHPARGERPGAGMERLVGFPLVTRTPRGSSLTPAGALLADWARDVLQAAPRSSTPGIDDAAGRPRRPAAGRGEQTVAEHLLPGWLGRLAAASPGTAVSLEADEQRAGRGGGRWPARPTSASSRARTCLPGCRTGSSPATGWSSSWPPVTRGPGAGAGRGAPSWPATRLVQREATSGTRTSLELALARFAPLATPLLELSTSSSVRSAVAAGAGPAVLSDLAVRDGRGRGSARAGRPSAASTCGGGCAPSGRAASGSPRPAPTCSP